MWMFHKCAYKCVGLDSMLCCCHFESFYAFNKGCNVCVLHWGTTSYVAHPVFSLMDMSYIFIILGHFSLT